MPKNRLQQETSPYLHQHADNPVDWYPWGDEAFNKARLDNKPILLSIGYSACHWCHVMAHESFSDQETADIMNALFINIKVDREERPDLDKIYQTAHYLLTQRSGGWPLTVFLTQDLVPYFSGTYFPKEARYQLPSFKQVLQAIAEVYASNKTGIQTQNQQVLALLQQKTSQQSTLVLDGEPIKTALQQFEQLYDHEHGGFNGAPKFPQVTKLLFLLEQGQEEKVITTLQHMAKGGIYDQIGGGFFRYTVDAAWQIPHFEKMLYDNALLLYLMACVMAVNKDPLLARLSLETATWCIHHLSNHQGFYSSMDADSSGQEGGYYLWDQESFAAPLDPQEHLIAVPYFGLDKPPNVDQQWHLVVNKDVNRLTTQFTLSSKDIETYMAISKEKLRSARNKRESPPIDNKILTSWNALMVKALYAAGHQLNDTMLIKKADDTLHFILKNLFQNGKLYAVYAADKTKQTGFLDDYIYLIDAILMSLQIVWNTERLQIAIHLAQLVSENFLDEDGGFYFTPIGQKNLLYRPKNFMDEALPAGNGVAAQTFLLLGYLLANNNYLNIAEALLKNSWSMLKQYPTEHCSLLLGLKQFLQPPPIIILRGSPDKLSIWQKALSPGKYVVFVIPKDEKNLPEALASKQSLGEACAYVCQGNQCSAVIHTTQELLEILAE